MHHNLRKLAELGNLIANRESHRVGLFEYAPVPMCVATETDFVLVNRAMCIALKRKAEELEDKPWLTFIHPDDKNPVQKVVSDLDGDPIMKFESRLLRSDEKWVRFSWYVSTFVEGKLYSVGIIIEVEDG